MKCRILLGGERVLTPNKTPSKLFEELKEVFGKKRALDLYTITETEDFQLFKETKELNAQGEVSFKDLLEYANRTPPNSMSSLQDIIKLMRSLNIENSSDFTNGLDKMLDNGLLLFTREGLKRTKLFDNYTIENILESTERQEAILKTYKTLHNNDSITIQDKTKELENSLKLTREGTVEKQPKEVEENPSYFVEDGELVEKRSREEERLNRVLTFQENGSLSESISFLRDYATVSSWSLSGEVQSVLGEIESYAQDNGFDLRGLRESYLNKTRTEVLDFLDLVERTLEGEVNVTDFTREWENYLNKRWVEQGEIADTDIIVYESDEQMMFDDFSLIKVEDNLWRLVEKEDGMSFEDYKEYLGINQKEKSSQSLGNFYGDYQYLSTEFESDFGKYLLRTNNENFIITNNGIELTYGVFAQDALASIKNQEILENLGQYSLISKKLELPLQVENIIQENTVQMERDMFANNPTNIQPFKGTFNTINDAIYTSEYSKQFMNFNGVPMELVYQDGFNNFYKPLTVNTESSVMTLGIPKPTLDRYVEVQKVNNTGLEVKEVENREVIEEKFFKC